MDSVPPVRILFVDDEHGIRETVSAVLKQHGFDVVTSATVPDALLRIASDEFDVLLADLNIGSPGDGFTVVSAMKRTHKDCVTLILTGYPAFDTALQAIRSQVDDYLIKPAHPRSLVEAIEDKLRERKPHAMLISRRLHEVLQANAEVIAQRTLEKMKADPEIGALPLSDEERVGYLPEAIKHMSEVLGRPEADLSPDSIKLIVAIGKMRRSQQYPVHLMIRNVKLVQSSIYEIVHENLLSVNLSLLLVDLRRLNEGLADLTEYSVGAYLDVDKRAA